MRNACTNFNVTVAAEIYPPAIGGPATFAAGLVAALRQRGITVRLVTYADSVTHADSGMHVIDISNGKTARAKEYMRALMHPPIPAVVLALGTVTSGIPTLVTCRRLGVPMVLRCPGDYAWEVARRDNRTETMDTYHRRFLSRRLHLIRRMQDSVCEGATKIMVPCSYLRRHFSQFHDAGKIVVVPNAPSLEAASTPDNTNLARPPDYVYVGRFIKDKGIDTIVRAFCHVVSVVKHARLILVGDGPERNNLRELVRCLDLADRVVIVGPVSRRDVLNYLSKALANILNSTTECCTNVATEALALGTPLITPQLPGNEEVMSSNTTLFFEHNNSEDLARKMLLLSLDQHLFMKLSANSIARATRYTFSDMIAATVAILDQARESDSARQVRSITRR